MIELELKARVEDWAALLRRLENASADVEFTGSLIDRRFDFADGSLTARDEVVRVREYRGAAGNRASLEWKGPTAENAGYKQREEIGTDVTDADVLATILRHMGLRVTRTIRRDIRQFRVEGATVRLERYPRMDDLVEVEGDPEAIEHAIEVLHMARSSFSSDSLAQFTARYESRTGERADTGDGEQDA